MKNPEPGRGHNGFTLIELLVVLALAMILMLLTAPSMLTAVRQGKLRGFAQETAVLMRQTRLEAVKFSAQGVVRIVPPAGDEPGRVEAFSDRDGDSKLSAGERVLGAVVLPKGVQFLAPPGWDVVEGFSTDPANASNPKIAVFNANGAIAEVGVFRFGDTRQNFLEIRVAPAATARIELRKARQDGSTWNWYASGDGGEAWTWN